MAVAMSTSLARTVAGASSTAPCNTSQYRQFKSLSRSHKLGSPRTTAPGPHSRRHLQLHAQASGDTQQNRLRMDAARYIVDAYVRSGMTIGLGASGPGANCAIEYLGQKLSAGRLEDITAVPIDPLAASQAACHGVPLLSGTETRKLDFAMDSADEIQYSGGQLLMVKGCKRDGTQPDILAEKRVATAAEMYMVFAEADTMVDSLQAPIPVVVEADAWEDVAEELDDLFMLEATVWRRPSSGAAPPHGGDFPVQTAEGHNILDLCFEEGYGEWFPQILEAIEGIDGVVGHGGYVNVAMGGVAVTETNYIPLYPDAPNQT